MLRHLNTDQREGKLVLQYLKPDADVFEYELTRTVMGISFEEGVHVCVMGERLWTFDERSSREQRDGEKGRVNMERIFIVLAETSGHLAEEVFEDCVTLKDDFRCRVMYGPDTPVSLVESLQRTEGLSRYPTDNPHIAGDRWKSFRSFDTRLGLYMNLRPDETTIHRDLEMLATTPARDPETHEPILSLDGTTTNRFVMPTDFPTEKMQAGFRQGRYAPCEAMWYATMGMENSHPRVHTKPQAKKKPFVQSGY